MNIFNKFLKKENKFSFVESERDQEIISESDAKESNSKQEYLKMSSTGIKLKKDGTPDLRFKNAKSHVQEKVIIVEIIFF